MRRAAPQPPLLMDARWFGQGKSTRLYTSPSLAATLRDLGASWLPSRAKAGTVAARLWGASPQTPAQEAPDCTATVSPQQQRRQPAGGAHSSARRAARGTAQRLITAAARGD